MRAFVVWVAFCICVVFAHGQSEQIGNFKVLNSIRFADQFPGADIGAKVNAAVADLPLENSKPAGTVVIATGDYTFSTPIMINSPFVKLIGPAWLTYVGTGIAMTFSDAPTSYEGDGGVFDITLSGAGAGAVGIRVNECTWFRMEHVSINMTGAGAIGILFDNTQRWTEQLNLDQVHLFQGGIVFQDNCPGHTGCFSFAYARFRHVVVSPPPGGTGILMQDDTGLNAGDIELQCFGGPMSPGITCLSLTGTSNIELNRLKIGGESKAGPSNVGIKAAKGTIFSPIGLWEHWVTGTWSDSIMGSAIPYIYSVPGLSQIIASASGIRIGNAASGFDVTLDTSALTSWRYLRIPNGSGTVLISGNDVGSPIHTGRNSGCTTAGAPGASCTTTVSFAHSFGDNNYTVECQGVGVLSGVPVNGGITVQSPDSVTFQTVAVTNEPARFGAVHCTAVHD